MPWTYTDRLVVILQVGPVLRFSHNLPPLQLLNHLAVVRQSSRQLVVRPCTLPHWVPYHVVWSPVLPVGPHPATHLLDHSRDLLTLTWVPLPEFSTKPMDAGRHLQVPLCRRLTGTRLGLQLQCTVLSWDGLQLL